MRKLFMLGVMIAYSMTCTHANASCWTPKPENGKPVYQYPFGGCGEADHWSEKQDQLKKSSESCSENGYKSGGWEDVKIANSINTGKEACQKHKTNYEKSTCSSYYESLFKNTKVWSAPSKATIEANQVHYQSAEGGQNCVPDAEKGNKK